MTVVFETKNFVIETPEIPHVDKFDGGQLDVRPKEIFKDRTQLSPELAKEMMKLTMVAGEALKTVLSKQGIDVARVNYMENGNWNNPPLHEHLYGRAIGAKIQKYGEALHLPKPETGFYDNNSPLNEDDIRQLKEEIQRLLQTPKYKNF